MTGYAVVAGAAAAWLIMWATAYRLRPPLTRTGVGRRMQDYLLMSWRGLASIAAAVAIVQGIELISGRNALREALDELGLSATGPTDRLAALGILLFLVCFAINLGFALLRQTFGVRRTVATVNMPPRSIGETIVYALVLSPVTAISEEIVFRGLFQWLFISWTADPVSAVASQAVLFGILHMYQGGLGVLRTVVIGCVLGVGTLVAGSLVPAMIAHTLINIAVALWRAPAAQRA